MEEEEIMHSSNSLTEVKSFALLIVRYGPVARTVR